MAAECCELAAVPLAARNVFGATSLAVNEPSLTWAPVTEFLASLEVVTALFASLPVVTALLCSFGGYCAVLNLRGSDLADRERRSPPSATNSTITDTTSATDE